MFELVWVLGRTECRGKKIVATDMHPLYHSTFLHIRAFLSSKMDDPLKLGFIKRVLFLCRQMAVIRLIISSFVQRNTYQLKTGRCNYIIEEVKFKIINYFMQLSNAVIDRNFPVRYIFNKIPLVPSFESRYIVSVCIEYQSVFLY